ncbi:MAG: DNA polymerase III subunit beta [Clostridia bacterium]|nr:DNA polymerase III subunit beta [Clostridia bacterium]
MKIICDRATLSEAVTGVSRAVAAKTSVPILEGILIKAEGFQLTLTGYDLEFAIITSIEANVLEAGDVVLSSKLLGDMLHRLSSDEVEIEVDGENNTTIKSGITEFNIIGLNPGDYPAIPNYEAERTFDIEPATLRYMIDTTIYAVSTDDRKPAQTGELFKIEPDKLTIIALDGYRLAMLDTKIEATKDIDVIIPQKTVSEITKLLVNDDEIVHVAANRRFVVFATRTYTIMTRLIEGDFLDYNRVIPDGYKTRVVVNVRDFINSVERASLIITERLKNPLRIDFGEKVIVRCQTTLGKVVDEFEGEQLEGDSIEVGFNNRYMLDCLRNSGCEKVAFEIISPLSPVKVFPVDEDKKFLFLILPVRFKND